MKSKQTLKVGQKYRVIKDCLDIIKLGKIITVDRVLSPKRFLDKNDVCWWLDIDKLQLITHKKEVKKWKFSRKELVKKYKNDFTYNIDDFQNDLLAKSTPKKKSKEIKQEDKHCSCTKYCDLDCVCDCHDKKQEDKKEYEGFSVKQLMKAARYINKKYSSDTPSLLNDIETIEEIEGMAIQTDGIQPEQVSNNDYFADLIGKLIRNDKKLTEILKEVMEGGK